MRQYIKLYQTIYKTLFKQKNWVFTGQIPYEYSIWRISVEFEQKPDILFWFTYRDNKIIFQGVSSEPMLDKEEILDYSEKFKNGTLLDK